MPEITREQEERERMAEILLANQRLFLDGMDEVRHRLIHRLIGVQPMTAPTGLIFYLRQQMAGGEDQEGQSLEEEFFSRTG